MKNLKTILSQYYGINTDRWVKLLPLITTISLDQEGNIFADENELYFFDTNSNILSIARSMKFKKLTEIKAEYSAYEPYIYIDMNKITGFISTSVLGPFGTIIERPY